MIMYWFKCCIYIFFFFSFFFFNNNPYLNPLPLHRGPDCSLRECPTGTDVMGGDGASKVS